MLRSWDPIWVVKWRILVGQVNTLTLSSVLAALGESARALRQAGLDCGVLRDPVGESIFTVLDDGLAGFIAIISIASLAWCDWSVIDKLKQVLAVACNDGKLLAMLAQSIKLIGECSL